MGNQAVPAAHKTLLLLNDESSAAAGVAAWNPSSSSSSRFAAPQVNGCAFCIRMHIRDAISHGETQNRLAVLPAWRDTQYFTPEERHALAIAESTTLFSDRLTVPQDEVAALNDDQIAAVEWVACAGRRPYFGAILFRCPVSALRAADQHMSRRVICAISTISASNGFSPPSTYGAGG